MSLSKEEYQQLQEALLSAFPSKETLRQMVRFELGASLDAIAGGSNQSEVIFNLIGWAETCGKSQALIEGAYHHNSTNPKLKAFYENYQKSFAQPSPENTLTMTLDLQALINNKLLDEIASCFTTSGEANLLLLAISFPKAHFPQFSNFSTPMDFWLNVCEKIDKGLVKSDFIDLLAAAHSRLPGNKVFAKFAK